MEIKVKDVVLPEQAGCQHFHVIIENELFELDTKYYHWSDLSNNNLNLLGDSVFLKIKMEVENQQIQNREELKIKIKDKIFNV